MVLLLQRPLLDEDHKQRHISVISIENLHISVDQLIQVGSFEFDPNKSESVTAYCQIHQLDILHTWLFN